MEDAVPPTAFLARLIGLFAMIVAASVATHKAATLTAVTAILHDAPVLMALGFIGLAAGLAMVLCHNVWKGGLLPVLVTLAGWVILLRGVVMLALPQATLAAIVTVADYNQFFYGYASVAFVIGAYMTIAGFRRRA